MAKKYLDDNGLLYFWGKLKLTFALISHTHTKSQITDFPTSMPPTSHTHGNITNAGALQSTDITIATGDKIVVTDGSNSSKVARTSLAFDTATSGTDKKALTQAGTWQTFLTSEDVPEGASASSTTPKALGADNHPDGYVGAETAFARGDHVHPLSPVFTGATASANGTAGLVPAPPSDGDWTNSQVLSNGNWRYVNLTGSRYEGDLSIYTQLSTNPTSFKISKATTTTSGLMSSADKSKLDSITMTNGVIDSSVLPSFVDDVIEAYARTNQTELGSTWLATGSATGTVITPEAGKIYVLMNSSTNYEQNTQFRWGGTAYVQLNDSGCTSITNAEIDTIVAQ